jgi:STE24 endopeptidase
MNPYLVFVVAVLVGGYLLDVVVEWLNLRHIDPVLPAEFRDVFDAERYARAQEYLRVNTRFDLLVSTIGLPLTLGFIFCGGFQAVDDFARGFALGPIATGLIFAGVVLWGSHVLQLPATAWHTFVIEERFGFNRTTWRTFCGDALKAWLLGALIGAPVIAAILWFFAKAGPGAWLYCWLAMGAFQFVLMVLAPVLIMPLFNKYTPLEEGDLRTAIERYAAAEGFRMRGVYKMDGSRRSGKSNAFFTGLGGFRRIVLFDTLIANHSVAELVAIVAHEMGHYKLKHIPRMIALSLATSGLMFFLLSLFMENPRLFAAFRMERTSVYASLFFFAMLYTPIATVMSIAGNALSRRHEFEADAYAAGTTGTALPMIAGLKKLSSDNLSNLTPHPLKVFLSYSHPPVLARIRALQAAR